MFQLITRIVQTLLPHHALSRMMHGLTRMRHLPFRNALVRMFIRIYNININEALEPDHTNRTVYPTLNSLFTRALHPDARPIAQDDGAICSPVDGTISQLGAINDERIFQAKGFDYSLTELLGGSEPRASQFRNGCFATLYLSPRDYHRIHMPVTGTLQETVHIPGRLFSVSPTCINGIPRLFTRNERVVTLFDTEVGPMAMILVGAIFVGSIETVWAGEITPPAGKVISTQDHSNLQPPLQLQIGEEMGRFNMGSTVILLFGQQRIAWEETLKTGQNIRLGQKLAQELSTGV
jgi:phosphatidylserine decarboxylase